MNNPVFFPPPPAVDSPDRELYMCLLRLLASGGSIEYMEWYHLQVMERINTYKN